MELQTSAQQLNHVEESYWGDRPFLQSLHTQLHLRNTVRFSYVSKVCRTKTMLSKSNLLILKRVSSLDDKQMLKIIVTRKALWLWTTFLSCTSHLSCKYTCTNLSMKPLGSHKQVSGSADQCKQSVRIASANKRNAKYWNIPRGQSLLAEQDCRLAPKEPVIWDGTASTNQSVQKASITQALHLPGTVWQQETSYSIENLCVF